MILADRWACSRLQIELVIVESMRIAESSKEPSTEVFSSRNARRDSCHKAAPLLHQALKLLDVGMLRMLKVRLEDGSTKKNWRRRLAQCVGPTYCREPTLRCLACFRRCLSPSDHHTTAASSDDQSVYYFTRRCVPLACSFCLRSFS
jgi:hypothetical protein